MTTFERKRNWRWQIVDELVKAGKCPSKTIKEDPRLMRTFRFWNAFQKVISSPTPATDSINVEKKYPDVAAAYHIYSGLSMERYFIEALIMSNEDTDVIAIESGYHEKVIKLYEYLFFSVRDKLEQRLYVMGEILGPLFAHGSSGNDYDHLWKAVGYFCGSDTLKSLWKLGKLSDGDREGLENILRTRLLTQATTAVFARRPGSYNAGEVIDSFIQHTNMESKSEAPSNDGQDGDNYLAEIKGDVLEYLQLTLRPYDSQVDPVERCLAGKDVDTNDEYDRPVEFTRQSKDS